MIPDVFNTLLKLTVDDMRRNADTIAKARELALKTYETQAHDREELLWALNREHALGKNGHKALVVGCVTCGIIERIRGEIK